MTSKKHYPPFIGDGEDTTPVKKTYGVNDNYTSTDLIPAQAGVGLFYFANIGDGGSLWYADGAKFQSISPINICLPLPVGVPPSSTFGSNGAITLGTKTSSATVSLSGTSGSVTVTFSSATLLGTSGDNQKHITLDNGKLITITAFSSSTVCTGTITGTLSGTGPFSDWVLGGGLVLAYYKGYMYFPANKIDGANAAGFYYTEFASKTVGIVYNNLYTPGTNDPIIPASPTPFVCAATGAFTQTLARITLISKTIPPDVLGNKGSIRAKIRMERPTMLKGGGSVFLSLNNTTVYTLGFTASSTNNSSDVRINNMLEKDRQRITASYSNDNNVAFTVSSSVSNIDTKLALTISLSADISSVGTDLDSFYTNSFELEIISNDN